MNQKFIPEMFWKQLFVLPNLINLAKLSYKKSSIYTTTIAYFGE